MTKKVNPNKDLMDNLFGNRRPAVLQPATASREDPSPESFAIPIDDDEPNQETGKAGRERKPAGVKAAAKPAPTRKTSEERKVTPSERNPRGAGRKPTGKEDFQCYVRTLPDVMAKFTAVSRDTGISKSQLFGEILEKCIENYERANGPVSTEGVQIRRSGGEPRKVFKD